MSRNGKKHVYDACLGEPDAKNLRSGKGKEAQSTKRAQGQAIIPRFFEAFSRLTVAEIMISLSNTTTCIKQVSPEDE